MLKFENEIQLRGKLQKLKLPKTSRPYCMKELELPVYNNILNVKSRQKITE